MEDGGERGTNGAGFGVPGSGFRVLGEVRDGMWDVGCGMCGVGCTLKMYTCAGGCRQWYAVGGCMMQSRNEQGAAVCSGGGKGGL